MLKNRPFYSKQPPGFGFLGKTPLQCFYQIIPLFDDAVLDLKNFLPLAALLFFQLLYFLLDVMLFVKKDGEPGLPLQDFNLLLGVF